MKAKVKFCCPNCGKTIEARVNFKDYNEVTQLDPPCQCGFSQVVLGALRSGIERIVEEE